jgi:hypothetical protein
MVTDLGFTVEQEAVEEVGASLSHRIILREGRTRRPPMKRNERCLSKDISLWDIKSFGRWNYRILCFCSNRSLYG